MESNNGLCTFEVGTMTIEVESIRPMLDVGACKAFAKVKFKTPVGSISIDNFRLIENKSGKLFVSPPSHKKGEKFYDDVRVTEDLEKYLRGEMVRRYKEETAS